MDIKVRLLIVCAVLFIQHAICISSQRQLPPEAMDSQSQLPSEATNSPNPFDTIGCIQISQSYFSTVGTNSSFQVFSKDVVAGTTSWASVDLCSQYCLNLASYTFAGLEVGRTSKCFCFNDSPYNMTTEPQGSCDLCMTRNVSLFSIPNCLAKAYSIMYVVTTCPPGYYTPPLCQDRTKATCLEGKSYYNGQCLKCAIIQDPMGVNYTTIMRYCDVLMPVDSIRDFRMGNPGALVTPAMSTNFLNFNGTFISTNSTLVNNPAQGRNYLEGIYSNAIVVFPNLTSPYLTKAPPSADTRVYLRNFRFLANASGAFYFSMWLLRNFSDTYGSGPGQLKAPNVYNFMNSLLTCQYKSGILGLKHFFDPVYDGIQTVNNLYIPLRYGDFVKYSPGYHSLDSAKVFGGTGTPAENYAHSSLICNYVYSWRLSGIQTGGVPAYMNAYLRDTIPGWRPGQEAKVTNSDYYWWQIHFGLTLAVYSAFSGLGTTDYHWEECFLKFLYTPACPDQCQRQSCDDQRLCTYGCVSGYMGTQCTQPCAKGTYGPNCNQTCDMCLDKDCNPVTGICNKGCLVGYILKGIQCVACAKGTYGINCNLACSIHCSNPENCDPVTGNCANGCAVGYMPPLCEVTCLNLTYGINCTKKCGNCKGAESCDLVTGDCNAGCAGKEMPPNCMCLEGTWGVNCQNTCGLCYQDQPCNPKNGYCIPAVSSVIPTVPTGTQSNITALPYDPTKMCSPSVNPPLCICLSGTWGADCDKSCGNCLQGLCMADQGSCLLGCSAGYTGTFCDMSCAPGTWGAGCASACGNCIAGSTCDPRLGNCSHTCKTGYNMPMCIVCAPGYWGTNCEKTCGNCKNQPCFQNGSCPFDPLSPDLKTLASQYPIFKDCTSIQDVISKSISAADSVDTGAINQACGLVCQPGYEPLTCLCKTGYYGDSCDKSCGNCLGGCAPDGSCFAGCVAGYYGVNCSNPCPNGKFGPNCKFLCGHCFNNTGCTAEDGICKVGCDPGYMLPKCICPSGYYGDSCQMKCGNCTQGTSCSFVDASCPSGCAPGFRMPYCNCSVGTYRLNCSGTCGNCAGEQVCDLYTGACPSGCLGNSKPPLCSAPCDTGKYGPACFQRCGHCKDCQLCDPNTGMCPSLCDDGYLPPLCKDSCPKGFYGQNCTKKCGYCYNGAACDPVDGVCDRGCLMGYLSPYCTKACPDNTWGFNCLTKCGRCAQNKNCNYLDGTCPTGCIPNVTPPYCTIPILANVTMGSDCPPGYYVPPVCSVPCGKCLNGQPCQGIVGFCEAGCQPGYQPFLCNSPCTDGLFGANCLEVCGNCSTKAPCRKTDGVCIGGCADGFVGDLCRNKLGDPTVPSYYADASEIYLSWKLFTICGIWIVLCEFSGSKTLPEILVV